MGNFHGVDRFCMECFKIKPTEGFDRDWSRRAFIPREVCADCVKKIADKMEKRRVENERLGKT